MYPPFGYAGKILRINLDDGETSHELIHEDFIRKFFGGAGFGAYYLCYENPVVDWADPQNTISFMNGPLSYTAVRGSGTICVTTKGPMTNLAGSTQGNGYMGAYLKSCGFDGILLRGRAARWSYLLITEDKVALKDATHLVGKDTQQTQEILRKEIGRERGISIYCIGPAAEYKVRYSVIIGDGTHVASKNGVGAVLASKNVKAIVIIRGKFKPRIWNPNLLKQVSRDLHEKAITWANGSRHKWGTNGTFSRLHEVGALPVKNYTTNLFPTHEKMDGKYVRTHFERVKRNTCFNCGMNHILVHRVTEGPYKGFVGEAPEYEAFAAFGPQIGQTDAGAVFVLTDLTDRLGIDVNEAGWTLGWVMECYEKGILTKKEMDGLEMVWGNTESTIQMLKKIAYREGIGNLLAEGVKRASEEVGGEAQEMAITTLKGATPRGHDHRARWPELLDTCFTNTSSLEATFVGVRPHLMDMPSVQAPFSPWEVPTVNAIQNGWAIIEDCVGACRFNLNYPKLVTDACNAVTNADLTIPDMLAIGKRVVNTLRVFNFKNGLTEDMEAPSQRYGSAPVDGPAKGIRVLDHWPLIREIYYRAMGWHPETGRPQAETLRNLDLEDLIPDIEE